MRRVVIAGLVVAVQVSAVAVANCAAFPRGPAPVKAGGIPLFTRHGIRDSVRCEVGSTIVERPADSVTPASSPGRFAPRWRSSPVPIVVQVEDGSALVGWSREHKDEIAVAFRDWEEAGAPPKFRIASDKGLSPVHVRWVEKFDAHYDGWTTVTWDADGWIVAANLTLSIRDYRGRLLSKAAREQVMLHEIGHLLGLAHSSSASSIMRGEVKATTIADVDRGALASLYPTSDRSEFASANVQENALQGRCRQPSVTAAK